MLCKLYRSSSCRETLPKVASLILVALSILAPDFCRATPTVFEGEYVIQISQAASTRALLGDDPSDQAPSGSDIVALVKDSTSFRTLSSERRLVPYDPEKHEDFCAKKRQQPGVKFCEPNFYWELDSIPNDTNIPTGLADIQASEAWDLTTGSKSIVVAVTDTGVDYTHPDLKDNIWINENEIPSNGIDDDANGFVDDYYGYDFFNNDSDPYDDNGHGTHVAGTIGAKGNNGLGVVGVTWNVRIMPVKFLSSNGGGSTLSAVRALNYAAQMGAQVINASWGGPFRSQILEVAVADAVSKGVVVVAASGNAANNNDTLEHFPSGYPGVIAVGATDSEGALAYFSNYGQDTVHLTAPGVSVLSTFPGASYRALSGTSMAAPHVAGAVALMLSQDETLSSSQISNRLVQSADVLPGLIGKIFSAGRLNLYRALTGSTGEVTARALYLSRSPYTASSGNRSLRRGKSFYMGFSGTAGALVDASIEVIGKRGAYECSFDLQLDAFGTNVTAGRLKLNKRIRPTMIRVQTSSSAPVEAAVRSLKKSKTNRTSKRVPRRSDCSRLLSTFRQN